METIIFENDIKILYIQAASFPDGILAAHQKLHGVIPFSDKRKYYGISRPENGAINYKAGAEELTNDEAQKFGLDSITLPKGKYACKSITDYMKNLQAIGQAFDELTALPNIDPQGYCVEWYVSDKDVKCMVKLGD